MGGGARISKVAERVGAIDVVDARTRASCKQEVMVCLTTSREGHVVVRCASVLDGRSLRRDCDNLTTALYHGPERLWPNVSGFKGS